MKIFGPNRQSIRLPKYDYASVGAYFVTICTQDRLRLFGDVENQIMRLLPVGEMIQEAWENIAMYDPRIVLDEFIVMPDHFHGIVVIQRLETGHEGGRGWHPAPTISLSTIIGRFKSWTTRQYRRFLERNALPAPLDINLWQRNYYERIIRNENELNHVRQYIRDNPKHWDRDPETA